MKSYEVDIVICTHRLYRISVVEKQTQVQVILFTLNNKKPVLCVFKNIQSGLQPSILGQNCVTSFSDCGTHTLKQTVVVTTLF